MIHILLVILKIMGIVLLVILGLLLGILLAGKLPRTAAAVGLRHLVFPYSGIRGCL